MENALDLGKKSTTGSFKLFIGKILSTVILALGAIIVGLYIREGEYGLYAIALIPATIMLLFSDWGIGAAMTRFCSQYRASKRDSELRSIVIAGLRFEVISGVLLTVLSIFLANFIALNIFGKAEASFLIVVNSITIISTGLLTGIQSVFVGFERMGLNSISMAIQAIVATTVSPVLVVMGYGALGAIVGFSLSFCVACIVSFLMLYFKILNKLDKNAASTSWIKTIRPLLSFGVPLALGNILVGVLPQIYSLVMASTVDTTLIGNYRIAMNFAVLLTFFTFPIATVLFPTFSKVDNRKDPSLLKTLFMFSVKYSSLLLIPATVGIMVLADPLVGTLYGAKWQFASDFLSIMVIINLFSMFGSYSLNSFLNATGNTRLLMKLNIVTLCIGVPISLVAIPNFGIIGLIAASVVSGLPSVFIGLYWIWKHYGVKANLQCSGRILAASAISGTVAYLSITTINGADWLRLAVGAVLFLFTYLALIPVIGALNQSDINNLRAMSSNLGVVSRIIRITLSFMEKTALIFRKKPV
jgi:O-antigen/teichoic acid export membrane protein